MYCNWHNRALPVLTYIHIHIYFCHLFATVTCLRLSTVFRRPWRVYLPSMRHNGPKLWSDGSGVGGIVLLESACDHVRCLHLDLVIFCHTTLIISCYHESDSSQYNRRQHLKSICQTECTVLSPTQHVWQDHHSKYWCVTKMMLTMYMSWRIKSVLLTEQDVPCGHTHTQQQRIDMQECTH